MRHLHQNPGVTLRRSASAAAAVTLGSLGLVALPASAAPTDPTTIDLAVISDFHGHIEQAAALDFQFDAMRAANPNMRFLSVGDSVGGSAYVSSVADDDPTINILNAMELKASAVGNHEFDQGAADLFTDIIGDNLDGSTAAWTYLGANVSGGPGTLAPYVIEDINGVQIAYIGTVTDEVPTLVSPSGISGMTFANPVTATNNVAALLKDGDPANGEADVVVALMHDGSETVSTLGPNVDIAFGGHTHVATSSATTATGAPVCQTSSAGADYAKASITVGTDGTVTASCSVVAVDKAAGESADIKALFDAADAKANVLGAGVVGNLVTAAYRGSNTGAVDGGGNRGTESTAGNLLAEGFWEYSKQLAKPADLGVMNPGGIRDDFNAGDVTFKESNTVQPFGNVFGTADYTGAQIKTILEEQWNPDPTASRPVLRLGLSSNVAYAYDPAMPVGQKVTYIEINGAPIDPAATYTIASNTFLLEGGDGFVEFGKGTGFVNTGMIDNDAFNEYLKANNPTPVSATQRSFGVTLPKTGLQVGKTSAVKVSSLSMTADDPKPTSVELLLDGVVVGTGTLDNAATAKTDETGQATIDVTIPADKALGAAKLTIRTDAPVSEITVPVEIVAQSTEITILNITDFHGHIENLQCVSSVASAARAENPNTILTSSGDNIGGSLYESSIADDDPTVQMLSKLGLEVSAVGNHEFDQGYADLTDDVIADNGDGATASWKYLGANVEGASAINEPPYFIKDYDGVKVAFIGTVTESTPTVVDKAGIQGLTFTDPIAKTSEIAAQLKDGDPANGEADVVVALFHESASFATGIGAGVDVVFASHSHEKYDGTTMFTAGGAPVVQSNQYGETVGSAKIVVGAEGIVSVTTSVTDTLGEDGTCAIQPADAEMAADYEAAAAKAEVLGAEVVGCMDITANRGTNTGEPNGSNRGTESVLGNLIADSFKWKAEQLGMTADFGIMNPGGLRADLAGGDVTYGSLYSVQPFGNTVGTIDLTGAQVKTLLEQQWQPGKSRPMLHLGLSENVSYTYDDTRADGDKVTSITIDGVAVDPAGTYKVASNTFLLTGQDNFTVLAEGTNFTESGYVDLDSTVDYFKAAGEACVSPVTSQRSVGVTTAEADGQMAVALESLNFTGADDPKATNVTVQILSTSGSAAIENTITEQLDGTGKAVVMLDTSKMVASDDYVLSIVTTDASGKVLTQTETPVSITGGTLNAGAKNAVAGADDVYEVGEDVSVLFYEFMAGSESEVILRSDPVDLGTFIADPNLEFTVDFKAPSEIGTHTVTATSNFGQTATYTFEVVAAAVPTDQPDDDGDDDPTTPVKPSDPSIPATGAAVGSLLAAVAGLLLAGFGFLALSRREEMKA